MPCPLSPTPPAHLPLCQFWYDENGSVLVQWGLFLAVAFGFMALSFDLGRVASTQSEMQSFADQVALAAAGELDGRPDAITRATAAANGLISDAQTYATGAQTLGRNDFSLTFLRSLPASDTTAATDTTTDGARARYVRVDVKERTVMTPFAAVNAALTGRENLSSDIDASATAGFTSYACDITPLMFCVPDSSWKAGDNIGSQIKLRAGGQNAAWGPGNFGFLDPSTLDVDSAGPCAGLNGAQLYRCLVGAENGITRCVRTDTGLDTLPGQRQGLAEAFNTRFDIFQGSMQQRRNDPAYRPAANTVQGTLPSGTGAICRGNNVDPSDAMPLPRDACIDGTCGRFGDGDWDRAAYVSQNHGGFYPPGTGPTSSRYEMYLAELAAATSRPSPDNVPLPGFAETGAPQCHALGPSTDPKRRNVNAAAVDCSTNNIQGSTSNVVALEFVELFMTEPVQSPGGTEDAEIMVEIVGSAGGIGSGALSGTYRDFIQLYR
ncbi:Tad domain-containing protein [Yoonia sp.]|uniref:Tad domain-containing protein n=1 Tax=Yoonia sp. TaxID=2212373 RepID=UPI001A038C16|nr:Tad domain-containing protein [Yoonia sp.]MBE0413736.1 Tad domain-containing protein [Yoonia sp.]